MRVLACRPVDRTKMPPGSPPLPDYEGDVEDACQECGERVLVGPRQQAVRELFPDFRVLCMADAARVGGRDAMIADLGNDPIGERP